MDHGGIQELRRHFKLLAFSHDAFIVLNMSTKAQSVLEEFKALPPDEQRAVSDFILRRLTTAPPASARRRIADIAGKYHARPDAEANDHDRGFAEALA